MHPIHHGQIPHALAKHRFNCITTLLWNLEETSAQPSCLAYLPDLAMGTWLCVVLPRAIRTRDVLLTQLIPSFIQGPTSWNSFGPQLCPLTPVALIVWTSYLTIINSGVKPWSWPWSSSLTGLQVHSWFLCLQTTALCEHMKHLFSLLRLCTQTASDLFLAGPERKLSTLTGGCGPHGGNHPVEPRRGFYGKPHPRLHPGAQRYTQYKPWVLYYLIWQM